jgi:endonuclease G
MAVAQCSRKSFKFKNDLNIRLVGDAEYKGLGYDKGHLANAEDFAYDCVLDEETFRYYNYLPQTPNLNRGIWKVWETKIRNESQQDSLLVICGGVWEDRTKGNLQVPVLCWKVIKNLRTHQIEHVLIFTNESSGSTVKEERLDELEKMLNLKLPI